MVLPLKPAQAVWPHKTNNPSPDLEASSVMGVMVPFFVVGSMVTLLSGGGARTLVGRLLDGKSTVMAAVTNALRGVRAVAEGRQAPTTIPHIRFWSGFADRDLSSEGFLLALKKVLIPDTTVVGGHGRGLIGYMPVVVKKEGKPAFLPDEIAFVVYENEVAYRAIREFPEGRAYQAHHFVLDQVSDRPGMAPLEGRAFFSREIARGGISNSSVIQLYDGTIEHGSAYLARIAEDVPWQGGVVQVRIRIRKEGIQDLDYQKAVRDYLDWSASGRSLKAHGVRIERDYILEYLVAPDHEGLQHFLTQERQRPLAIERVMSRFQETILRPLSHQEAQGREFPLSQDGETGYQLLFPTSA